MAARTREESEELVVAAVKEMLPLLTPGSEIQIEKIDPDSTKDGAHFTVSRPFLTYVCRRVS